jgi:hypothetical protein
MIQTSSIINNPFTGVFGNGQVQMFLTSGTFTVPAGVGKVRVRLWGAGGGAIASNCSSGGGFALKSIYDLGGVTSVAVTVASIATAANGGTSSFGSYVSATGGGSTNSSLGGIGVGGNINTQGGTAGSASAGGNGGAAAVMGNGGMGGGGSNSGFSAVGGAGGGAGSGQTNGGAGFMGSGGYMQQTSGTPTMPSSGLQGNASIDFIGMGGGGGGSSTCNHGINGGGAGSGGIGGFPAGGGSNSYYSGAGLVIVEW